MNQPDSFGLNTQEEESLERELIQALRPVDPPEGFAERTLARASVRRPPPAKVLPTPAFRRWVPAAVAAMLLAGVLAGEAIHVQRQRLREQQARAQFAQAIEITDRTLARTQQKLVLAGIRLEK